MLVLCVFNISLYSTWVLMIFVNTDYLQRKRHTRNPRN